MRGPNFGDNSPPEFDQSQWAPLIQTQQIFFYLNAKLEGALENCKEEGAPINRAFRVFGVIRHQIVVVQIEILSHSLACFHNLLHLDFVQSIALAALVIILVQANSELGLTARLLAEPCALILTKGFDE